MHRGAPGVQGSSPLTRGALATDKSVEALSVAHPRSRGEHQQNRIAEAFEAGSSPLTRGAHRGERQKYP